MDTERFAITEEGQVYRPREHGRPLLLGHISCLAREETPLGREVRAWWQSRLASDEPVENVVELGRNEPCFVRTSEDTIEPPPEQESTELVLAPIENPAA